MQPPLLELRGINKSFGPVQVLRDVAMTVRAGEVTALQDARNRPTARAIDPPGGLGHRRVLVNSYDRTGGRLSSRAGLDHMKLHDPRSPA